MTTQPRKPAATALYRDGYGQRPAFLHWRKTARGDGWRWVDDRGIFVDGLPSAPYSVAYQLRHARRHARFTEVRED